MAETTIDTLLSARNARRLGSSGNPAIARAHLHLNRMLWGRYDTFSHLRPAFFRRKTHLYRGTLREHRILNWLEKAGVLARDDNQLRIRSNIAKRYLAGGWLEQLAYCAIIEAGADEAYYAQTIGWTVDGIDGANEIDVIARRGDTLSIVSCKTAHPIYRHDRPNLERLKSQLFEARYWNEHFGQGEARAMLLTTADLLDDARDQPHSEILFARAAVLDVDMIGRYQFTWDGLVEVMRKHW